MKRTIFSVAGSLILAGASPALCRTIKKRTAGSDSAF